MKSKFTNKNRFRWINLLRTKVGCTASKAYENTRNRCSLEEVSIYRNADELYKNTLAPIAASFLGFLSTLANSGYSSGLELHYTVDLALLDFSRPRVSTVQVNEAMPLKLALRTCLRTRRAY